MSLILDPPFLYVKEQLQTTPTIHNHILAVQTFFTGGCTDIESDATIPLIAALLR